MADRDESARAFYDGLASGYDAIYDDWWQAAREHARVIDAVLTNEGIARDARLLDCACGIGTQAIPLAQSGYRVTGTDISASAIERAAREASARGVELELAVADMRELGDAVLDRFDAVIACDNAIPHLLDDRDLDAALSAVSTVLLPGGLFLASVRDYDRLRARHATGVVPVLRTRAEGREIVGQAWEWHDDGERLRIHLFVLRERAGGWRTEMHTTWYRALTRDALTRALERARFDEIHWIPPEQSGYYQPIVTAHRQA